MKKLFTLMAIIGASLVATKSNAQVYVNAGIGFSGGAVYEDEFPGYAYYDFPAWDGHYRDYYYYAHYRPFFERRYAGYFNGGRFDYSRFRGAYGRGYAPAYGGRGFVRGGYANRGFDRGGYAGRGGFAGGHGGFSGHGGFAGHSGGFSGHGGGGFHGGGRR